MAQTDHLLIAGLFDNVGHIASLLDICLGRDDSEASEESDVGARVRKGDTVALFSTQMFLSHLLINCWQTRLLCPRSHI